MRDDVPPDLAEAIALGGEMGRRFGEHDWAAHPLGPLATWPPELRATVAVALTSRFPIVLWLDPEQLHLVYNDAYVPMLGEKHPAALGAAGRRVWWDIWDSIGPMLAGVVETGKATWSDDLLLVTITAGRPEERYFTFSYSPIITADGRVTGVFCAVTETTLRVLSERRLSILNTVESALIDTRTVDDAIDAVLEVCRQPLPDLPFVAVYVAAGGATGLRGATPSVAALLPTELDTLTEHAHDTAHGVLLVHDLATLLPGLESVFDDCPVDALVLPAIGGARSGISGALVIGLNPLRPLDDQYRGFCRLLGDQVAAAFGSADAHEREHRRANALAELDRAKTAFLTNVSHEFRTPLTLLLGPVEDAIAAAGDDPAQVERLETVRRNAVRLHRMVNSLLDFSRVEAGRATAERVRVDVGALTAQIASSFAELCQRAGLDLRLHCRPAIAEVDVRMWETIVLNLLSNAVKFTLAGAITVTVEPEGADIRVRITDTGSGIAAEDLPHLFDRFYRAGKTRGRSAEGSGIGLSLVRGLIDLHSGSIGIDSEPGVGTSVTIVVPGTDGAPDTDVTTGGAGADPYVTEASQWLDAEPTADGPAAPGARELVLIADDNADMRRHLQRVLSARWNTIAFADGRAALDGVREHRPALVITDVMMPHMDGFAFLEALRADRALASIPVLMVSARAGIEASGEGFAHGADDYLPKPFSSADLVNRVAARLTAASRDREARQHGEARARRAAATAEFTAALGAATTIEQTLAAVLASPIASLDATGVAIGLLDDRRIRITYAGDVSTELRDRYHLVALDTPLPLTDVIRTGRPMVVPDATDADGIDPRYRWTTRESGPARDGGTTPRTTALQPIRDGFGSIVGAIALYWSRPRVVTPDELAAIGAAAGAISSTIDRVRALEREHRIATQFQEHLLDLDRRSTAAAVWAVYQPATESMRVGGDWYLVTPLDDPARVGISVGDVVGHGLPAATVMSRLRAATTAAAVIDVEPDAVLTVLQRCAAVQTGAQCSTVAYAVLDSSTHTLRYACAGHPYPLVIRPDGRSDFLTEGRRTPLAATALTVTGPPGRTELPPGSLVLLYTDGLVERRGEALSDGLARLAAAAAQCRDLPVGAVCDELLRRMRPPGGYTDDVALLALRPAGRTEHSFVATVPARAGEIPRLRHDLQRWLTERALGENRIHDVLLATCEALTNGIEHGSGPSPTTVSVEVFLDDSTVTVTISDTGQWTRDSSASHRVATRGRGLALINGLAATVDTVRSNAGTRVTMTHSTAEEEQP